MEEWVAVRQHPVFEGMTDGELKSLLPFFGETTVEEGQYLVEEGDSASAELFLILSGTLQVIRKTGSKHTDSFSWFAEKDFNVAVLSGGDSIGELSFVRGGNRSATVQCTSGARLLVLSPDQYRLLDDQYPKLSSRMMINLLGITGRMLKKATDNEVSVLKRELQNSAMRSKANLFFSYVIGLLCIYNLGIQQIINLSADANGTSLLSACIILAFCSALALMIRQSGLPLHFFGLTIRNWKPALQDSVIWTSVVVVFMIGVKWLLVESVPRYSHLPVFSFDPAHTRYLAFNFALYGLHSPVQEFIARGVLQGSLQNFFKGKHVTARAIFISNAIFSATHVHLLGGLFGAIVFVPGLFWGWMYARNQSLIGVSLSHIIIGWTALFFLDLESLFR